MILVKEFTVYLKMSEVAKQLRHHDGNMFYAFIAESSNNPYIDYCDLNHYKVQAISALHEALKNAGMTSGFDELNVTDVGLEDEMFDDPAIMVMLDNHPSLEELVLRSTLIKDTSFLYYHEESKLFFDILEFMKPQSLKGKA